MQQPTAVVPPAVGMQAKEQERYHHGLKRFQQATGSYRRVLEQYLKLVMFPLDQKSFTKAEAQGAGTAQAQHRSASADPKPCIIHPNIVLDLFERP